MKTDVLILAAGLGRRFIGNKMMYEYNGRPLVSNCLSLCTSLLSEDRINSVTVVVSNETVSSYVKECFPDFSIIDNPHPEDGISSSIRTGIQAIRAANPRSNSTLILLGDMPNLTQSHIISLIDACQKPPIEIAASHVIGSPDDDFRNPIVISSKFYDELLLLSNDHGAKSIIKKQYNTSSGTIAIVDTEESVLCDIDTRK